MVRYPVLLRRSRLSPPYPAYRPPARYYGTVPGTRCTVPPVRVQWAGHQASGGSALIIAGITVN
eukprot:756191-Hanusia_phi.AAC.1